MENPGFSTAPYGAHLDLPGPALPSQQSSSGLSPSAPSSGDSSRRSCPQCHGRISSLSLDRHSLCCKCRGADCNHENRCDECMGWYVEEMKSYVKLRTGKSLVSKSKGKKSSSSKAPSFPRLVFTFSIEKVLHWSKKLTSRF